GRGRGAAGLVEGKLLGPAGPLLPLLLGGTIAPRLYLAPRRVVRGEIVVHVVVAGRRLRALRVRAGVAVLVPQTGRDKLPDLRGRAVHLRDDAGHDAVGKVLRRIATDAQPQPERRVTGDDELRVRVRRVVDDKPWHRVSPTYPRVSCPSGTEVLRGRPRPWAWAVRAAGGAVHLWSITCGRSHSLLRRWQSAHSSSSPSRPVRVHQSRRFGSRRA